MPDVTSHMEQRSALRAQLKARVQKSITSADPLGRTVEDPAKAAEYVVNALMEWPDGRALIQRLAAHLNDGDS